MMMKHLMLINKLHSFHSSLGTCAASDKVFQARKLFHSLKNVNDAKLVHNYGFQRHKFSASRLFHTSERRNIPPALLLLLRPLSKFGAALTGRIVRKWWQSLPPDKKQYVWAKVKAQQNKLLIGTLVLSGGAVVFYVSHLEETPISKRKRFVLFGPELYESLSQDMFRTQQQIHLKEILPLNHPTYKFVGAITDRLLLGNRDLKQIYSKTWSITIVDDDHTPNAYVLPSGQIFVFTGMLKLCESPDQLACILGHEMAHAVLGHSLEMLSYTQLIDAAMMVVVAIVWAILPTDLTSAIVHYLTTWVSDLLLELPYSRMLEVEADEVGLQLAAKACFDIRESSVFWHKMSALQDEDSLDIEWLSTHPVHEARAETLDKLIPEAIELRKTCKCPPLASKDPRAAIKSYKEWIVAERKKDLANLALMIKLPPKLEKK